MLKKFLGREKGITGLETAIKQPLAWAVDYLGRRIQVLQMGDIRTYCLYIIFTLIVLLIVIFR